MKPALSILLAALLCACSTTADKRAVEAGWADAGTTAAGLAMGAAEANPIGLAGLLMKPIVLAYAETLPLDEKVSVQTSSAAMWGGASANNLCIIGVLATGAIPLAALCPMIGVAWGLNEWNQSQDEREYAAFCAAWLAEKPGVNTCEPFKRPA